MKGCYIMDNEESFNLNRFDTARIFAIKIWNDEYSLSMGVGGHDIQVKKCLEKFERMNLPKPFVPEINAEHASILEVLEEQDFEAYDKETQEQVQHIMRMNQAQEEKRNFKTQEQINATKKSYAKRADWNKTYGTKNVAKGLRSGSPLSIGAGLLQLFTSRKLRKKSK